MRLWSLHPKYLDSKGLVALWRESLLAKKVLQGNTKGYTNHPQLIRFKHTKHPLECINQYLSIIYNEAQERGYNFDKEKIDWNFTPHLLPVNKGQINYEWEHLLNKLIERDHIKFEALKRISNIEPHPLFEVIKGEIEAWEIQ